MSVTDLHPLLEELFSEPVDRVVLDNGMIVLLKPDTSYDFVSAQLWVKTGSMHEGPLLGSGISHFLEHMLFKGTSKRSAKEISKEIHSVGGNLNAYTNFDRTAYQAHFPKEALSIGIDVLSDLVCNATLPEGEFPSERDVILREIDMGLDDPIRKYSQEIYNVAYKVHPYRHPVIGHRQLFETITYQELKAYYKTRYVPNNMVFIVAGSFDAEECLELIKKHVGHLPMARLAPAMVPEEPKQLASRESYLSGDYNVVRGGVVYKIPHLSHPDAAALDILASVLGSGESSLLWQHMREDKQLVHDIDVSTWRPGDQGLFWIYYSCDVGKREAVEKELESYLETVVKKGFPLNMVEKCIRQAVVGEVNLRKTVTGQASRMGIAEVILGEQNYIYQYFKDLYAVGTEKLKEVAAKYLINEGRSQVALEPVSGKKKIESKALRKPASAEMLPEEITLKSGVRVLLLPKDTFPKVHMRVVGLGGPLYDPKGKSGLSQLMSILMTRGTEKRTMREISEAIESVGGVFREFCGNNSFGLDSEVLCQDESLALELLDQAIHAPLFLEDAFEIEREDQIASIEEAEDGILSYGRKLLRENFFGDHPYASRPLGQIKDLKKAKPEDVRKLYEQLVVGKNLVFAVSGAYDQDKLLPKIEKVFKPTPTKPFEQVLPEFKPQKLDPIEITLPRKQAVVLVAYPDPGVYDRENYLIAEVLDEIFSGMSSQLFERVREDKGLAYYVGSNRLLGLNAGMFSFYAGTHPSKAEVVFKEIDAEVNRVLSGKIRQGELDRAKTRLKVSKKQQFQIISDRALVWSLDCLYGIPIEGPSAYGKRVDAVELKDLQVYAEKFFNPEHRLRLTVNPE